MKNEQFKDELGFIRDRGIQLAGGRLIDQLPDYFFTVAASSTGKYHPEYALGDGGLVRHTKAAVRFAHELLENPIYDDKYSSEQKDMMILALLLHDGLKHGDGNTQYTVFEHPLLAAAFVRENGENAGLTSSQAEFIAHCIESHMGPWTRDRFGKEVLPRPADKFQNFVHMCDYLASRKCFTLKFDESNRCLGG